MEPFFCDNIQLPSLPESVIVRFQTENGIVPRNEKSGSEMMMELLQSCKVVNVYEYYDGVHMSVDGVSFLLTTEDENNMYLVFNSTQEYFSTNLPSMNYLEEFVYTSRFYDETDYSSFTNAPQQLRKLQISTCTGLNNTFIQNLTHLHLDYFSFEIRVLFPNTLTELRITTLAIMDLSDLQTFLEQLSNLNSFQLLTIEEVDDDENSRDLFDQYLPGKWRILE